MWANWHNDMSYWPFDGNHVATVWIACKPVTMETSGLIYVAGSHKWGEIYQPAHTHYNTVIEESRSEPLKIERAGGLKNCPEYHNEFDNPKYKFLSWELEPGDVLVHHPMTDHGSGYNKSKDQQRVAIALRYFGGDATWHGHRTLFAVPGTEDDSIFERGKMPIDDKIFPVVWRAN